MKQETVTMYNGNKQKYKKGQYLNLNRNKIILWKPILKRLKRH